MNFFLCLVRFTFQRTRCLYNIRSLETIKKKGGQAGGDQATTSCNSNAHPLFSSDLFLSQNSPDCKNATPTDNDGAHCSHFKQAGTAFWNEPHSVFPSSVRLTMVNDLARASSYIYNVSVDVNKVSTIVMNSQVLMNMMC